MSELREVLTELHGANIAEQLDNLIAEWPTWGWPRRTSSYELEMRGYESLQSKVRYGGTPVPPIGSADRHRFATRVHRLGRQLVAS